MHQDNSLCPVRFADPGRDIGRYSQANERVAHSAGSPLMHHDSHMVTHPGEFCMAACEASGARKAVTHSILCITLLLQQTRRQGCMMRTVMALMAAYVTRLL